MRKESLPVDDVLTQLTSRPERSSIVERCFVALQPWWRGLRPHVANQCILTAMSVVKLQSDHSRNEMMGMFGFSWKNSMLAFNQQHLSSASTSTTFVGNSHLGGEAFDNPTAYPTTVSSSTRRDVDVLKNLKALGKLKCEVEKVPFLLNNQLALGSSLSRTATVSL